ncbi:unnamed protein product [Rotaria sp. Silwood1]|nr:unnamed protein product [Rotaria sp. Silwood1]
MEDEHKAASMTFQQVLENSSNIGFMKISQRLGSERFYKYARDFGFGISTGIELPGENRGLKDDGTMYINTAIESGAKAIITDVKLDANEIQSNVLVVKDARKTMALFANVYNQLPSEKLKLIGVTGTNGKTTTTYLIKTFLENSGYKTGLLGTIDYQIGDYKIESKLTTPESIEICSMLSEMVKQGYQYCVMEVSSIALVMNRVYSLNFDSAIFTNLTSEHLDFHHNMENYFDAKKILFDGLSDKSYAITNLDDVYGKRIVGDTKAKKITYALNSAADFKAENTNFEYSSASKSLSKLTSKSLSFSL